MQWKRWQDHDEFHEQQFNRVFEMSEHNEILKLRDESGFPVWSGWRRR